jgi:TatD DNase family protein
MILNFHTHRQLQPANGKAIVNIIVGEDESIVADGWFSAGLHPWYFDEHDFENRLTALEALAADPNVKLIGECGLDRLRGVSLDVQEFVFEKQIKLAEKLNKPMVVHCVKCFSELLAIKKRLSPQVPLVIHGFNNKLQLGLQLQEAGFYFSLGAAILHPDSNAATFLNHISANRLFLETDDSEIGIEAVFNAAASIRKTTLNHLKDTIFANWVSLQKGA